MRFKSFINCKYLVLLKAHTLLYISDKIVLIMKYKINIGK